MDYDAIHLIPTCMWCCRYGKSSAQVLIRWSLQSGFVCIPKSVKEQRIMENGDVFDFNLSDDDMKILVAIINKIQHLGRIGLRLILLSIKTCHFLLAKTIIYNSKSRTQTPENNAC